MFDADARRVAALAPGSPPARREAALRELMDAHAPRLHAVATRMLGDAGQAEDIVQETFLKAWRKAGDWEPGRARFSTWLHRVTINACLDVVRRPRPVTGVTLPERADPSPGAEDALAQAERRAALREAMDRLPVRQRAALALSLEGPSQSEAASALGITEGAYESLLVRARRAMRASVARDTHPEMHHAV